MSSSKPDLSPAGSSGLDTPERLSQQLNDRFYERLPPIKNFADCLEPQNYTAVPDDWQLLMSDVRDSTDAIRQGRYKTVNMVGAATITAVLNVSRGLELPYMFGGDGATVIVPPSCAAAAARALSNLTRACRDLFGLELRVGAISASELRAAGHPLRVCKYELSPGNHLGFLSGTAHDYATERLKNGEASLPGDGAANGGDAPDLTGLSCRWEPIRSSRGHIATLIVQPLGHDTDRAAPTIIDGLESILGGPLDAFSPAGRAEFRFRWPPRGLALEARALAPKYGWLSAWVGVLYSSLGQLAAERLRRRLGPYDPARHADELRTNTDYRKLDGLIRVVIDISPAQVVALRDHLEEQHRNGWLAYGLHVSDAALMTCLVFDLSASRHVHFLDGADGGHTRAALDLKARLEAMDGP